MYLLLLLTGLFTSVVSAPWTPDPFPHSDLNSWFPPPFSGGFSQDAKLGDVHLHIPEYESNPTSTIKPENPSVTMKCTRSCTFYAHNGSAASMIAAIGRAVSEGVDVIRLDVFCPKIQKDLHLATAVWQARLGGTVVLCQGGPKPQFVQVFSGEPPITKRMLFSVAGGHSVGAAFVSEVQVFSADISLVVSPRVVSFKSPCQENKNVTVTVSARTGAGGSGKRQDALS